VPAERRPAILAVDDEPTVLAAVARDLRRGFGERFRILRAGSGAEALSVLGELRTRGDQVAMLIADQRMPGMPGTDYLVQARMVVPDAKRVLLTAYADTEAAIAAINDVALDYYLLKPWDPPEEHLFPVVEDLLTTWEAGAALEAGGVRVIGHRFSKDSHDLRDFLARNRVPARWLDVERDGEARELLQVAGIAADRLPVALLEDGAVLERPTVLELAERLGVANAPTADHYDLVIVGGGPAGLAAAVYGASEGLKTVLIEREAPGGQAGTTSRIENYLGFPAGLTGGDLARRALAQARRLGAEILSPQDVTGIRREDPYRVVMVGDGPELSCQTVVVATGVSYLQLDLPNAAQLAGAGIYYGAATTEAVLYRDMDVGVVGGGNSAGQAVVHLSRFARSVVLLVRGDSVTATMSQYLIEQMEALPNVRIRLSTRVTEVRGDTHLTGLTATGPEGAEDLELAAVFMFIGQTPRTEWLEGSVMRDDSGFVLTGPSLLVDGKPPQGWPLSREPFLLEASMPGVFCAGDVRSRSIKRIASAVGEGSMAVQFVHQYLADI
jgi:thioredoxin reductase (NADPH)